MLTFFNSLYSITTVGFFAFITTSDFHCLFIIYLTTDNINVLKQVITYFAIGLVIALGVVFLIYYFDRTIKSVEQVEQKVKLPILGSVQILDKGGKK